MEIIAKAHVFAGFVLEGRLERHLRIEFRTETDALQNRGHTARGLANIVGRHLCTSRRRCERIGYCFFSVLFSGFFSGAGTITGKPFSAMICIASFTGIWAMPAFSSTHR